MSCDNCLCHLHICVAECCREFKLTIPRNLRVYNGMVLQVLITDPDMVNYYKLHGIEFNKAIGLFKLDNFKRDGEIIIMYKSCNALTKNNLCSLHVTDKQPKICEYPNKTGTGGKVYLTSNCVYKKE